MKDFPSKIYLNICPDAKETAISFNDLSEVTWSKEKINHTDIDYVHIRDNPDLQPVFDCLENHGITLLNGELMEVVNVVLRACLV